MKNFFENKKYINEYTKNMLIYLQKAYVKRLYTKNMLNIEYAKNKVKKWTFCFGVFYWN
jgi:hypothetical protein